jgi:hypothetical protein
MTILFQSIGQVWSLLLNNTGDEEKDSLKKPAVTEAGL